MSLPEDSASISTPRGSNTKRGACDRCRGQKLRCLYDGPSQDTTCVRCFKAGATCSFGRRKRLGRPPASAASSREHGGNLKERAKQEGIANANGHPGFLDGKTDGSWGGGKKVRKNATDDGSEGETEDVVSAYTLSPSSLNDASTILAGVNLDFPAFPTSSTTTLPWPDDTFQTFYDNDAAEASTLGSFSPEYNWAFLHQQAQSTDVPMTLLSEDACKKYPNSSSFKASTPIPSTNAQMCGGSDEAMDLDVPSQNIHAASTNSNHASRARQPGRTRGLDREQTQESTYFSLSSTSTSARDVLEPEASSTWDEEGLSAPQVQHRRMQELSELAMNLYVQLTTYDPETPHLPGSADSTTTAFNSKLVGSVLKSSNTFLTLLTSFSPPAPTAAYSPSAPTPLSSMTPHDQEDNDSTCVSSDSEASPSASSAAQVHGAKPTRHHAPPPLRKLPRSSSSAAISDLQPSTDMTTVLQLLTCYIRIIRLHSIMYSRILDYMRTTTTTSSSASTSARHHAHPVPAVPPVFADLHVGGVSLDAFGAFQVVLLLQVTVYVLGEIELALGLPEEYRVGACRSSGGSGGGSSGGRRGVLEASVSGGFVQCLMREGAWREKRVEGMREQLEDLKAVLRGAMEF